MFRRPREDKLPLSRRGIFERYILAQGDATPARAGDNEASTNLTSAQLEARPAQAYLLVCTRTRDAVLIDAASGTQAFQDAVRKRRARLRAIVLTHGHGDQWSMLAGPSMSPSVGIGIHIEDADLVPFTPNFALADGQRVAFGAASLDVLHTPGHTPGSVMFLADGELYSGDTVLASGPGTTLPPDGDAAAMRESLRSVVLPLPETTVIYPARGSAISLAVLRPAIAEFVGA